MDLLCPDWCVGFSTLVCQESSFLTFSSPRCSAEAWVTLKDVRWKHDARPSLHEVSLHPQTSLAVAACHSRASVSRLLRLTDTAAFPPQLAESYGPEKLQLGVRLYPLPHHRNGFLAAQVGGGVNNP